MAVVLGAVTAAILATGLAGGSLPLSLDGASFASLDVSQLGGAFDRGELRVEAVLIGAAIALAVGIALPLLATALRRPRRSMALPDTAPTESTEQELGARAPLEWPTEDLAPHLRPACSSPGALEQASGTTRLPVA